MSVNAGQVLAALLTLAPDEIDPHFQPATQLCEIGAIPFDYIAGETQMHIIRCNMSKTTDLDHAGEMDWLSRRIGSPQTFHALTSPTGASSPTSTAPRSLHYISVLIESSISDLSMADRSSSRCRPGCHVPQHALRRWDTGTRPPPVPRGPGPPGLRH